MTYQITVEVMTKNAGAQLDANDVRELLVVAIDDALERIRKYGFVLDVEVK